MKGGNLLIGTILRSLEIEDQYCYPGSPMPRFVARSFINSIQTQEVPSPGRKNSAGPEGTPLKKNNSEEYFFEASDDFDEFETPMVKERTISDYFSAQNFLPSSLPSLRPPEFDRIPGLIPDNEIEIVGFTLDGSSTFDSFVKAQIVIYDQQSPLYKNVDNRVNISNNPVHNMLEVFILMELFLLAARTRMIFHPFSLFYQVVVTVATLTFFCHRPTVIAIMEFMNAINLSNVPDADKHKDTRLDSVENNTVEEYQSNLGPEPAINRLLDKGKNKAVFHLTSSMAEAQILLMNENGDRLATLSQNNLSTDIKVMWEIQIFVTCFFSLG
jgi:vacuolar protein sorting-associated protein 13A/C